MSVNGGGGEPPDRNFFSPFFLQEKKIQKVLKRKICFRKDFNISCNMHYAYRKMIQKHLIFWSVSAKKVFALQGGSERSATIVVF